LLGLLEREPTIACVAPCGPRSPEDDHIDTVVTPAGDGVAGHDAGAVCLGFRPWAKPWCGARFQLGNDAIGYLLIQAPQMMPASTRAAFMVLVEHSSPHPRSWSG